MSHGVKGYTLPDERPKGLFIVRKAGEAPKPKPKLFPRAVNLYRHGKPSPSAILEATAAASGYAAEDFVRDWRKIDVVVWRFAAYRVMRDLIECASTSYIGKECNRDHSTIVHAFRRYRQDPAKYDAKIARIKSFLTTERK